MNGNYQQTFEDLLYQQNIDNQPDRVAYIDESGSFGFDFTKDGNTRYYVLCAVIVEECDLNELRNAFQKIKISNGLIHGELKSNTLSDTKRFRIITQLLLLPFKIVLFIADKQKFCEGTPLTEYKPVFIKNMAQHLYNLLYQVYPKLRIFQDEVGRTEFQVSFKNYVAAHRKQLNLFNQYDFNLVNSKDEVLVQMSDVIGGSVRKFKEGKGVENYIEILRGKITTIEYFPSLHEPYWGEGKAEDNKYNATIFALALKFANDFITKYETDDNEDRKMQVALVRYLLNYATQTDATEFVYADELIKHLAMIVHHRVIKNHLFRKVIAPLRDEGVILASCAKGYKIPISVDDLIVYLNSTSSTAGPMIRRMGKCRDLIKRGTDNKLDLFDDPAFIRYKRYFDGEQGS